MDLSQEEQVNSSTDTRTPISEETTTRVDSSHTSESIERPISNEPTRTTVSFTDTNELRQRNVGKDHAPTITQTATATTTTTGNYKDDSNYNGGGFYECNIW
jgi:hypothetical protein